MSNPEVDQFKQFSIEQAANDRFLRGITEWNLYGKTDKLSPEAIDNLDEGELSADLAEYYNLSPEDTAKAYELCEQLVIDEGNNE